MGSFCCFGGGKEMKEIASRESMDDQRPPGPRVTSSVVPDDGRHDSKSPSAKQPDSRKEVAVSKPAGKEKGEPVEDERPTVSPSYGPAPVAAKTFTLDELDRATDSFAPRNFVGEGGFGRVYRGVLESTKQVVAVKQLDRNGLQGNREFLVEVLMLSLLHHPNLVNLVGYCADGDQRLLVYEFMERGCLEDHLHDLPIEKECLEWNIRMKVAAGAARGLEYLHDKANPPVIYRDFKSSNILLDADWLPKLSDFGLAKLGPVGDKTHVSTRVMGTYGYCAPEYAMTGQLTLKSDVYSFGVVLLELITGRKAIDNSRDQEEHNLVAWARPLFKDRRKFPSMADPLLRGRYPMRGLYQALAVAAMCLQEQANQRPVIADVVTALSYLAAQNFDPNTQGSRTPTHEWDRRRNSHSPALGRVMGSPQYSPDLGPRGGARDSPDGLGVKVRGDVFDDSAVNRSSPSRGSGLKESNGRVSRWDRRQDNGGSREGR